VAQLASLELPTPVLRLQPVDATGPAVDRDRQMIVLDGQQFRSLCNRSFFAGMEQHFNSARRQRGP